MLFLFDRLACCISLLFLFFMRFLIFLGWSEIECRIYSPQSISQTIIYCSSSSLVDYVGENLEVPAAETAEGEVLDFLEVMEDGGCSMGIYGIDDLDGKTFVRILLGRGFWRFGEFFGAI